MNRQTLGFEDAKLLFLLSYLVVQTRAARLRPHSPTSETHLLHSVLSPACVQPAPRAFPVHCLVIPKRGDPREQTIKDSEQMLRLQDAGCVIKRLDAVAA